MSKVSSPEIRPLIQVSRLPVFNRMVKSFDQSAEKIGLHETAANFLAKLRCRVNISYESPETVEILRGKPTIIITTHNKGKTEGFPLVASLPPRDDLYILGSAGYMTWGETLRKSILPLYISNKSTPGLMAKILTKTEFENRIPSQKETYSKNASSVKEAAKKISEGHQVIISPEGNRLKEKPREGIWYNGLGHLINQLPIDSNAYIVMARIGNPRLQISKKSLFEIDVNFSEPIKVSDLLSQLGPGNRSPKKITRALERKYYGF